MKVVKLQELVELYLERVHPSEAIVKMIEESGELIRAAAKFLGQSYSLDVPGKEVERMEAFSHLVEEAIHSYITISWLLAQLDEKKITEAIGEELSKTLIKLELLQKLGLEDSNVKIEHGFPLSLMLQSVDIPDPVSPALN